MTVKVSMSYMDWADRTNEGSSLLDLPSSVQDRLEEIFDGQEVDESSSSNPDNVYINLLMQLSDREMADQAGLLGTSDEDVDFEELEDDIIDYIESNYTYLGHDDGVYYYLE